MTTVEALRLATMLKISSALNKDREMFAMTNKLVALLSEICDDPSVVTNEGNFIVQSIQSPLTILTEHKVDSKERSQLVKSMAIWITTHPDPIVPSDASFWGAQQPSKDIERLFQDWNALLIRIRQPKKQTVPSHAIHSARSLL
jgi:hypothetical protein